MYGTVNQIQVTPDQLIELPDLLANKEAKSHHTQTTPQIQEGTVAIAFIQQADGSRKPRPVLLLRQMPGYGDFLVCGISTQLRQAVSEFDEVLTPNADNQLRATSVARLSNLVALSAADIDRAIGFIPAPLHAALLQRLSTYLAVI